VQAALTGHLVLSTVHANNVFDVIGRFTHMGVDPYSFVAGAQRHRRAASAAAELQHCTADRCPTPNCSPRRIRLDRAAAAGYLFRAGRRLRALPRHRLRGRRAITEMLRLDDETARTDRDAKEPIRKAEGSGAPRGTRSLREAASRSRGSRRNHV
jgi:general secretion pathway protein E